MTSTTPKERFVFIDAWRGIAAMAVFFSHIIGDSPMAIPLSHILPAFVLRLSEFGVFGVQVFFVLSGFVIAHSLRNNPATMPSLGNFILRRQIRLDLPYWCAIIATLLVKFAENKVPSLNGDPLPPLGAVILNFVYLHKLFNAPHVLDVAWTLCLEIQFYLVFILILLAAKLFARKSENQSVPLVALFSFLLGCASLLFIQISKWDVFFLYYWYYFALGVLCYWGLKNKFAEKLLWALLGLCAIALVKSHFNPEYIRNASTESLSVGFLITVFIYIVGLKKRLGDLWNGSVVQFLGRISYSIYLTHVLVLLTVLRIAYKINHKGVMPVVWLLIATGVCIGVAYLFYRFIERPSMRLAERFKSNSEFGAGAPQVVTLSENQNPA